MLKTLNEGKFKPRPQVKEEIFAAIKAHADSIHGKQVSMHPDTNGSGKVVDMNTVNRWLAAASVVLFICMGATFLVFNQKINTRQNEIAALNEKYNAQLLITQNNEKAISKFSSQFSVINDVATKKIILKGVASFPDTKAVVYWNVENGKVFIDPANLPEVPADKQYQLWALLDGKPVDAGVFDIGKDSVWLQEAKNISKAQAFAVTLEQKGGVSTPTLSAMYVMGAI